MKSYNLKTMIGMGFLSILFAPVFATPEVVCQEIIDFVQEAKGNPREICRKASLCFPGAHEEFTRAASESNAWAFYNLLRGAMSKLPPDARKRLAEGTKIGSIRQIRKLQKIVEETPPLKL